MLKIGNNYWHNGVSDTAVYSVRFAVDRPRSHCWDSVTEVAASRASLASRTVFEVLGLGLGSQVLGLEPSKSSRIGLSSVEDSSFLLPFKSYISLKLFYKYFLFRGNKNLEKLLPVVRLLCLFQDTRIKFPSRYCIFIYSSTDD